MPWLVSVGGSPPQQKNDTIDPNSVLLLTNSFFGSFEAVAARVRGAAAGAEIPAYGEASLSAFKIRVGARRRTPPDVLPVHDGQDWMYVLSGRMRLILGERDFTIKPGEAVEFSTWTPHWFGTIDGPVEAIALFGPHGERMHVRD